MTKGPIISRTQLETRAGTVVHSDASEMNAPSLDGAKYFLRFVDVASENSRAAHMKSKGGLHICSNVTRNGLQVRQEHQ